MLNKYSSSYEQYIIIMPDGTIKQTNPLTGLKSWSVPGRGLRPHSNVAARNANKIEKRDTEDYCDFCSVNYLKTPPEKERLIWNQSGYYPVRHMRASELSNSTAIFRRVPNLFAIVTYDYWQKNYSYKLTKENRNWKEEYLSEKEGREHIKSIIKYRLSRMSINPEAEFSDEQLLQQSDHYFGSCHDLIIGQRHYTENAASDLDKCSSGELTQEEHYEFFTITIRGIEDIYRSNRYVRYVSVFQNWLRPAGATFDHIHKQLVGMDEWGASIEAGVQALHQEPHIYNLLVVNFAQNTNRVIADNANAIAFVDIGHRFPTIAVFSKSIHTSPLDHTPEEIRDFSDLVYAIHSALGSDISCNEEWYYTPRDCLDPLPWHIYIKLRLATNAGFEGATQLHINPLSPFELRDLLVPRLFKLRDEGKIRNLSIAMECRLEPNCLRYYTR